MSYGDNWVNWLGNNSNARASWVQHRETRTLPLPNYDTVQPNYGVYHPNVDPQEYNWTADVSWVNVPMRNPFSGNRKPVNVSIGQLQKFTANLPRYQQIEAELLEAVTKLVAAGIRTLTELSDRLCLSQEVISELATLLELVVVGDKVALHPDHPLAGRD